MKTSDFDYNLPKWLIAQKPVRPRDHSRFLVFDRKSGQVEHRRFFEVEKYLCAGDILVLNDTKVFRARLFVEIGGKKTELFFLRPAGKGEWEIMARPGKRLKVGDSHPTWPSATSKRPHPTLSFVRRGGKNPPSGVDFQVLSKNESGVIRVKFNVNEKKIFEILEKYGHIPVPPYVAKEPGKFEDYQTVYADKIGSVAAPTAGFHFTPALIKKLKNKGVAFKKITLHVGMGTFQPVKTDRVEEHQIHSEFAIIDKSTADFLNKVKKENRRIIAVGTTATRALEGLADKNGLIRPGEKFINIFIYPGYKFKVIDGLITNFHLPKSTLIMLVSAFVGSRPKTLKIYQEAINRKYRFYSFGDGMMVL